MKKEAVRLRKELGLFETTIAGIGIILGAGIYALVGKAAGIAGDAAWLSFAVAAMVAAFTGLSYAELSSRFSSAAGEYEYAKRSFGRRAAFVLGWIIIFSGIVSAATVALGFGGYLAGGLQNLGLSFAGQFQFYSVAAGMALIIVLSAVIIYGLKQSAWVAILFTFIEAFGLFVIIAIGIPDFGKAAIFSFPGFTPVFSAAALIFFAFIGFEEIVRLSEETRKAKKTIPRALLLALFFSTAIYVLVAISAVSILPAEQLAASHSPLADVAGARLGHSGGMMLAVIALFSTSNTVLLILLATSRITFGMARDSALPVFFSRLGRRKTPVLATIVIAALSAVFVMLGNIELAAKLTDFAIFATFMAVNAMVIWFRCRTKYPPKAFRVPLNIGRFPLIPLFGFISSGLMLLHLGTEIIIYGLIMTLLAYVLYSPLRRKKFWIFNR